MLRERHLLIRTIAAWSLAVAPTLAQSPSAVLGRVITADTGTPIAGATVWVTVGGAITSVDTDRVGGFHAAGLPSGRVVIRVACAGFLQATWPDAESYPDGAVDMLATGATLSGIEIRLARGSAIDGQVIDVNGLPAAGRTVIALGGVEAAAAGGRAATVWQGGFSGRIRFSSRAPAFDATFRATTDDRGRFRLHTLPSDRYVVGVLPRGEHDPSDVTGTETPGEVTWAPGTSRPADATVFVMAGPEERAGVTIRLTSGETSSLSGQVVDADEAPVGNAMVVIARDEAAEDEVPELSARSDANGRFRFERVPLGRWRVEAVHSRGTDTPTRRLRAVVHVDVDARPSEVRLALRERPSVRGRAVVRDGPAPATWTRSTVVSQRAVAAWSLFQRVGVAEMAEDGAFDVPVLSDTIELGVLDAPFGFRLDKVMVNGRDRTDEALPAVEVEGAEVELVFTATGAVLHGVVAWPGRPREQCRVTALSTNRDRWHAASRYVAMSECRDSRFQLGPLPHGEYYVAAVSSDERLEEHPGFFDVIAERGTRLSLARNDVTVIALPVVVLGTPSPR